MNKINSEARILTSNLDLADRVQCYERKPACITLDDHKPNFDNNQKCRLINPIKSEVGKISKVLLDKISNEMWCKTNLNQWRSTKSVIDWFQNLNAQSNTKFIKFDIVNFYSSISENLLEDAIAFANKFAKISKNTRQVIAHARKSLLFEYGYVWFKIDNPKFDVAMGSYDVAEVCELVGLLLLGELAELLGKENVGLHRDDGLAITNGSGPLVERTKKKILKLFQKHNLPVTTECSLVRTNFLDVSFNLHSNLTNPSANQEIHRST